MLLFQAQSTCMSGACPLLKYFDSFSAWQYENNYSRTSIIQTPMCCFNVKGVHISEFVQISELSNKCTV